MDKPEPLKGKIYWDTVEEMERVPVLGCEKLFRGRDIQSAVEWLKHNVAQELNWNEWKTVEKYINNAFEDVMK